MDPLRKQLVDLLRGGQAYDTLDSILSEFKPEERGVIPAGAEHSPWQILEHLRIAQRDIIDWAKNNDGSYVDKKWPDEYWPTSPLPSGSAWDATLAAYKADLAELEEMAAKGDLTSPFPWHGEHNLLRQILLAADHASHHLGQLVELKRWINAST